MTQNMSVQEAGPESVRVIYDLLKKQNKQYQSKEQYKLERGEFRSNLTSSALNRLRDRDYARNERTLIKMQRALETQIKKENLRQSAQEKFSGPQLQPYLDNQPGIKRYLHDQAINTRANIRQVASKNTGFDTAPSSSASREKQNRSSNTRPSPMQRANGYVARHTPYESPIATGSMGSLTNGMKPAGVTALFNALLGGGRQKQKGIIANLLSKSITHKEKHKDDHFQI